MVVRRSPTTSSNVPGTARRWLTINDGVRTTTTHTVTGLTGGTRYYFRVRARSAVGFGAASNVANAIPAHAAVGACAAGDTWQRTGDAGVDAADV